MDGKDLFVMYCMAVAAIKSLVKTIIAMGAFACIAWLVAQLIVGLANA